jgi:hypothetical protein
VSDTDTTEQPAARPPAEPSPGARALREALERSQAREVEARAEAAKLTPLQAENAQLRRTLGVVRAGVDPDSTFGKGVLATAAASGIDSPADVTALARVMVAEARGELPTNGQENHA